MINKTEVDTVKKLLIATAMFGMLAMTGTASAAKLTNRVKGAAAGVVAGAVVGGPVGAVVGGVGGAVIGDRYSHSHRRHRHHRR